MAIMISLVRGMGASSHKGDARLYRRHGYDLLNTFELRKGLNEDRRKRGIEFLGRRFYVGI